MPISADLGEKLEAVVNDLVANGRYNSKSEVLREGVRLVQEREAALARFFEDIEKGRDSVRRGKVHDAEEVFDRLEAKYQAMIDAEEKESKPKRRRAG
jgi:antitoxin ParD1/3/4